MIPVYKPYIPAKSLEYAIQAIKSTWISSQGEFLEKASSLLCRILGVKHVLLVNNGTAATHLVAKALMYKHPGSLIVAPNNVYVASWNVFLYDRQNIQTVDAHIDTWNFDKKLVVEEAVRHDNVAILAVHNIGNIVNVPELKKLCNVVVVEDNCEGFLGKYNGQYTGTDCLASSISFFGNKNVTCGEGGAVITNDTEVYDHLNCLRGQGQKDNKFIHPEMGYNYRMTNVQAAILLGQLECLDEIIEMKKAVFNMYKSILSNLNGISLQQTDNGTESANWMFGVRIENNPSYANVNSFLNDKNIDSRPMFYPSSCHRYLHSVPSFGFAKNESVSEKLSRECVILPSFPGLLPNQVENICKTIKQYRLNNV